MRRSRYALIAAIAGNLGMITGLLVMAGLATDPLILAAVFSLPLLASLHGLARQRVYTAAWASMMALFYMAYATVETIAGTPTAGSNLLLSASLTLFVGCVVFARWDARERPDEAGASAE